MKRFQKAVVGQYIILVHLQYIYNYLVHGCEAWQQLSNGLPHCKTDLSQDRLSVHGWFASWK